MRSSANILLGRVLLRPLNDKGSRGDFMRGKEAISSRAKEAKLLDERIAENVAAQEIDLVGWIFDRVSVGRGNRVLELCCGTGAQTSRWLDLVGDTGHVVALDVSREALDTLSSKIDVVQLSRLTLIEANMDELGQALNKAGLQWPYFDMIFCAYGLYYSADAETLLQEGKRWLKSNGVIVVVGPFGPNNAPLFELLQNSGVKIHPLVKQSSQNFMFDKVIPWATQNFQSVVISTVVNRVKWTSPENILNYWRNSTFYQKQKLRVVKERLIKYFENHSEFINEKWIIMVEMTHVRS